LKEVRDRIQNSERAQMFWRKLFMQVVSNLSDQQLGFLN